MVVVHRHSFDFDGIIGLAIEFNIGWDDSLRHNDALTKFLTDIIDALELWCKDMKITKFSAGFTQIVITFTFVEAKDAMAFKLRWNGIGQH